MDLPLWISNRWCAVEQRRTLAPAAIKKDILLGRCVRDPFTVLATPAPARDQTWFKACTSGRDLLIAIAVFDTAPPTTRFTEQPSASRNAIELFFDLRHDHLGYFQYVFNPDGSTDLVDHQPYLERHSTAHRAPRLKRYRWELDKTIRSHRLHWLWAWFDAQEVFSQSPVCGFNISRYSPSQEECSTWNHAAGGGFQDAGVFGHLYRGDPPARLVGVSARREEGRLHLAGRIEGPGATVPLEFELADPLDARRPMAVTRDADAFTAVADLGAGSPHGRYRIYPRAGAGGASAESIEPAFLAFDLAAPERARTFRFAITYDPPDNITRNYYTLDRLEQEFANYRAWGINRFHWIEHGSFAANPSFWDYGVFKKGTAATQRHVPDLLKAACTLAHKHGIEVMAVFKTFDLGFQHWADKQRPGVTVKDLGNRLCSVVPAVGAHQEWTMQAHPDWAPPPNSPVTTLRFYSRQAFPRIAPARVSVWTSNDNRRFTRYRGRGRGRLSIRQEKVRRSHSCWTPAGNVPVEGTATNDWVLEISGLSLRQPYVAIHVEGPAPALVHRMFAFAEARGADGSPAPLTLATAGNMEQGFSFGEGWTGWANVTQPLLGDMRWPAGALGLALARRPNLPTLLEPGFEGSRQVWLARLRHFLDSGADGVDVRTLCHHTGTTHYLPYAFAQPVREAFRAEVGRDVQPTPDDMRIVRLIRGRFYTQFLRDARAITAGAGRKLAAHLETGAEVPPELDQRMQMNLEWETWIKERLVDEISLKFFAVHHPFVQERVLPLARRHGVEVQVITRNLPGGLDVRAMELCPRLVTEACAAGFAGYSLYEAGELQRMNTEGFPMSVGHAEPAIRAARAALDAMG